MLAPTFLIYLIVQYFLCGQKHEDKNIQFLHIDIA